MGAWFKYGGARTASPSFPLVMVGQIITGAGQPFFLNVPTHYSDKWFSATSRVSATALMSLANAIGAAVGQLVNPFLATKSSEIPNMVHVFHFQANLASLLWHHCFSRQSHCPICSRNTTDTPRSINNRSKTSSPRIPVRTRTQS